MPFRPRVYTTFFRATSSCFLAASFVVLPLMTAATTAAAAPQAATAAPVPETPEQRAERLEAEKEEREKEKELEQERALERIEVANEEEDKLGPLGCACLSLVFPPLFPLWIVLMILVENEPAPAPTPGVGVEPAVPLERLQKERNAVAQRY